MMILSCNFQSNQLVSCLNSNHSSPETTNLLIKVLRQFPQVLRGLCVTGGCGVVFFGHLGDVFDVLGNLGADRGFLAQGDADF
jgi:hypothetical protein